MTREEQEAWKARAAYLRRAEARDRALAARWITVGYTVVGLLWVLFIFAVWGP